MFRAKWRHTRTGLSKGYTGLPIWIETHTRQCLDAECFWVFWSEVLRAANAAYWLKECEGALPMWVCWMSEGMFFTAGGVLAADDVRVKP